jgi:hypothetical protein
MKNYRLGSGNYTTCYVFKDPLLLTAVKVKGVPLMPANQEMIF